MPRKALHFASSPQSESKRQISAAFGHSPAPSPSWEKTPQSKQSWQPPGAPTQGQQWVQEVDTATLAAPTTSYYPLHPPAAHQATTPQVQFGTHIKETAPAHTRETVIPVMTSTRKRAAVGSLSPQIRTLSNQEHFTSGPPPGETEDKLWEARI
jgi:hypothetical protein